MFYSSMASITALLTLPILVAGQTISVKTLPLIATQQFNLAPSYNAGMGGISIALDDDLADGFLNPARITALDRNLFYLAPYRDSWSQRQTTDGWGSPTESTIQGSMVQAIPVGAIKHTRIAGGRIRLTTGLALSPENLRHRSHYRQFWDPEIGQWNGPLQMSVLNWPLTGIAAIQFPGRGLSVGVGVDAVTLHGVDGIALLYPGARELRQNGKLAQYRLGVSIEGPEESRLDFLLFHKRYRMEQDAVYDWRADIHNKDEEQSWLVQFKGRLPMEDHAQVGLELTGHWKWHPKIPDYPAPEVSIPRDPGITKAGRIGIGFSTREGKLLVAIDAAVEIIDSKTWGDTTAPVTTDDDRIIEAGDPLFRNDYFFTNALLRLGTEYQINPRLRVQAGWSTRQYSLDYYHEDYVTGETITATPQNWWKEPVLTGGIVAEMGPMEWIFQTSKRTGTGMPAQQQQWWPWWGFMDMGVLTGGDILAPPTGIDIQNVPVVMHRLTMIYWF